MSRANVYSSSWVSVLICLFRASSFRSSAGAMDPRSGGVIVSVGAMNFARRAMRRPKRGYASASRRGNFAVARTAASRVLRVPAMEQVATVGEGREAGLLRDHLEAMGGQFQVPDHLWPEKAAHVGT